MPKQRKIKQRQSNFTAVFALFLQHAALQQRYLEMAEDIRNIKFKAWLNRQSEFHNFHKNEIQELFEDLPEVPVKLSEQGKDYLENKENELIIAVNKEDHSGLIDLFSRAEQSLYEEYSSLLGLDNLLPEITDVLKEKQRELLKRMKKVQRLSTVPSEQSLESF